MANPIVLTNARIEINGSVLSTDGNEVTIPYEAETQDNTTFGDKTRANIGGLLNWSMQINFIQDFDAGKVDAILFPLVGKDFDVKIRAVDAAISANNPEYQGHGLLQTYTPLGGAVGDLAAAPINIVPAKSGVTAADLVRAVA